MMIFFVTYMYRCIAKFCMANRFRMSRCEPAGRSTFSVYGLSFQIIA